MEKYSILVGLLIASSFSFIKGCRDGLLENIDFPGTDITFLYSPSVEHCQRLCTEHHSCLFFTFIRPDWTRDNRHFYCYLKTPSGDPATQIPLLGVTSGFSLKNCIFPARPCFSQVFQNVDFLGADYRALFTPDYQECQRVCTKDPGCQFFTFLSEDFPDQDYRYKCHLKFSWNIPRTPIVEKKTGVTSGFAQKTQQTQEFPTTCQQQLFPNTDIPGSDLEELKSVSPEHCQVLCSANPQCTYFSFSSDDFSCYLKNNQSGLTAKPKKGTTSGIPARFCQLDDNWVKQLYQGVDFQGSDIEKELMDDAELCQRKCDEDTNCQFFTYVDQTFSDSEYWRRCYLKRVITMPAPPRVNKLDKVVSGFNLRDCQRVFV
ncbi:coagulation factor XI-like [Cyprinodon tularosa]|uniref:coagulation factor XI-like n=1 Tax=Cyprinodon tularosa TaxID=77115 RepID=UPI0018E1DB36|nr:coagulation factor XI-like [Cyprinodon tularosa]